MTPPTDGHHVKGPHIKGKPDHAGHPIDSTQIANLPNALTGLRLLAVPVLGWLMWLGTSTTTARGWAVAVFVAASLTDLADGAIARKRGQVTAFGKIADPIADKALVGTALIGLSLLGELWWWVTVLVLVREIGVTLVRLWVIEHGVIPASRGGKVKTVAQVVAIAMLLAGTPWPWWQPLAYGVMAVAVALTVVTGVDYVLRAVRLRRLSLAATAGRP